MQRRTLLVSMALPVLGACASSKPSGEARGDSAGGAVTSGREVARGLASWYGEPHHGRRTASGEVFDMNALTAAHRTLPFGTRVRVFNPANGRSVVGINDRGPYTGGRLIDLRRAAADRIGLIRAGVGPVVLYAE